MAVNATGTPTSPDSIARIAPTDNPSAASLTTGINAIPDTIQTALNSYWKKSFIGAWIYRSTSQSLGAADGTISFTDVDFDTSSFWSAGSPTRITIPLTGYYLLQPNAGMQGTFTGSYSLRVRKNGSTTVMGPVSDVDPNKYLHTTTGVYPNRNIVFLTAADYLEIFWSRGTSSNVSTNALAEGFLGPLSGTGSVYGYILIEYLGT
jgi:hypothetical protein